MSADLQPAEHFLEMVERLVARMDDWGYALALRYETHDRAPGTARMVRGGPFAVSCGFCVARQPARWVTFAITITPQLGKWRLTVEVEDETEEGSRFRWESAAIGASNLDEVGAALDRAFGMLDDCLLLPQVAAALAAFRANKTP